MQEGRMADIPQRLKTKSQDWLARRVMQLEDALTSCATERDELNAAFTSLSQLVYENQPHLLKRADPAAAELQRERRQNEEMK
jgi:hypothetical protein